MEIDCPTGGGEHHIETNCPVVLAAFTRKSLNGTTRLSQLIMRSITHRHTMEIGIDRRRASY
mgnify:FL=1